MTRNDWDDKDVLDGWNDRVPEVTWMTEMTRTTTDDWDDYWDMKLQKNYGYASSNMHLGITK